MQWYMYITSHDKNYDYCKKSLEKLIKDIKPNCSSLYCNFLWTHNSKMNIIPIIQE